MTLRVFSLTGGIASGKSTVAGHWRSLDLPVVDADELARRVVAPGTPGLAAVVERFGPSVLDENGGLDRGALGRIVFGDPAARRALEAIIHPRVQEAAREEFARIAATGERLACYEVPLLFETGQHTVYRPVVVVTVDEPTQLERAMQRDGLTAEEARARIAAQMPLAEKVAKADYVIDNTGPLAATLEDAERVLASIRASTGVSSR